MNKTLKLFAELHAFALTLHWNMGGVWFWTHELWERLAQDVLRWQDALVEQHIAITGDIVRPVSVKTEHPYEPPVAFEELSLLLCELEDSMLEMLEGFEADEEDHGLQSVVDQTIQELNVWLYKLGRLSD